MNSGNILIVDDTETNLKVLTLLLRSGGYQARPVGSGELALAAVEAELPELILLDIRMPGLDGFEVCRRLKAAPASRDVPIMFISATTEVQERIQGLKLGAVDFISKPFQREELLVRIHTHLELRRLRLRLEQQADSLRVANEHLELEVAERKRVETEREQLIAELQQTLAEVKTLKGFIPICSGCKKIRDDQGFWNQIESYIQRHSEAKFSHGLCPDCIKKYFPGFD